MTSPPPEIGLNRRVLAMDELAQMTDTRPRFEKEVKLPQDSRGTTNSAFLFSIDGMLRGQPVHGALLGGECMLVQARSLKMAERIAREGLLDTLRLARARFEEGLGRRVEVATGPTSEGLSVEAAGARGQVRSSEDPELLRTDPLLKSIIATEIGKLPWKH